MFRLREIPCAVVSEKMGRCVFQNCPCFSYRNFNFFSIPTNPYLLEKWHNVIASEVSNWRRLTKSSRVCLLHFRAKDFDNNPQVQSKLAMHLVKKPTAVPKLKCTLHKLVLYRINPYRFYLMTNVVLISVLARLHLVLIFYMCPLKASKCNVSFMTRKLCNQEKYKLTRLLVGIKVSFL